MVFSAIIKYVPHHNNCESDELGHTRCGRTQEQNLEIMQRPEELRVLHRPILLASSPKSIIGGVHDVKRAALFCKMSDATIRGWP